MLRAVREADLEGEDVEVIVKLNTFFCGMHNLVHFANNAVCKFGGGEGNLRRRRCSDIQSAVSE